MTRPGREIRTVALSAIRCMYAGLVSMGASLYGLAPPGASDLPGGDQPEQWSSPDRHQFGPAIPLTAEQAAEFVRLINCLDNESSRRPGRVDRRPNH